MKKFIYCLAALTILAACSKVESGTSTTPTDKIFSASFEGASKVTLGDDYYYRWTAGDLVSIFTEDHSNRQYKVTTGDVTETDLEYVSTPTVSEELLTDYNYAVFPYNAANRVESGVVYSTLAYAQTYGPSQIDNAIMTSRIPAGEEEFVFKNSCALLKINLKIAEAFEGLHAVSSIIVTSKANKLSGPVTIDVAGGDYTAKVDDATTSRHSVALSGCDAAGKLMSDKYLTFYLAIPAGTYAANDLSITILTKSEGTPFNLTSVVPNAYTVGRSQYLELSSTVAKDIEWFEQTEEEIIIKEDVLLTDKAIMTYSANLMLQGFRDQDKIETIFDVPDHDMTISGWDLVAGGYAQTAENGPTITFKKAAADHVMNTFTTTNSGLKGVTPNKMTVKSLTITGELRTTTMGIYVGNVTKPLGAFDQSAFNTEWINVNVVDCVVPLYTNNYGGAVCAYGTVVMNGCKIKGVSPSKEVPTNQYDDIYDLCMPNSVSATIKDSEIGKILTWEHMNYTLINSTVDYINHATNAYNATSGMTLNNTTVDTVDCNRDNSTINSLGTKIILTNNSKIGTLIMPKRTGSRLFTLSVAEGCTIEKVIVEGVEMTFDQYKEQYSADLIL